MQGWNGVPKIYSTIVSLNTLDNVIGERVIDKKVFYIVDVEGAEYKVIQGATKCMTDESVWFVEISIHKHMPEGVKVNPNLLNVFEYFWNKNFKSYTPDGRWTEVGYDVIYKITKTGIDTLLTHNFIFIGKSVDMGKIKNK